MLIFLLLPTPSSHATDTVNLQQYIIKFRVASNKWSPLASLSSNGELVSKDILKAITLTIGQMSQDYTAKEKEDAAGVCVISSNEPPKIVINDVYWSKYDNWVKEELVFHELGHCILGREHDDSFIEINSEIIKRSIMSSHLIDSNTYLLNRDYYHKELFQHSYSIPSIIYIK